MTKQLNCLLVDDEPPALRLLSNFVERISFLKIHKAVHDPIEALKIIEEEQIDVVFLDIQMPHLTGIQLAKIVKQKVKIIFTTAYPQFALESYDSKAVDYLLKPFEFERFYEAVLKLNADKKDIPSKSLEEPATYLFVKTDGKNNFERIFLKDIYYVEASRNYIIIYLPGKRIITHSTLKHTEDSLPKDRFIKIHKSYIISLSQIQRTSSQSVFINDQELPIGNTYRDAFFNQINQKTL